MGLRPTRLPGHTSVPGSGFWCQRGPPPIPSWLRCWSQWVRTCKGREVGFLSPVCQVVKGPGLGLPRQCSLLSRLWPWPVLHALPPFCIWIFMWHREVLERVSPPFSGLLRGQGQGLYCRSFPWHRGGSRAAGLAQGCGVKAEHRADGWS